MSLYGQASGNTLKGKINRLTELKGYSAYEIAVINGYNGTEEEWLKDIYGLSKSWAVGGTGMREGEDTDNSKYYSEQSAASEAVAKDSEAVAVSAKEAALAAKSSAENAAQSAAGSALAASSSEIAATASASSASTNATTAVNSATAARASENNAKDSETAAKAAQKAAEQARDEAQAVAGGDFLPLAGGTLTGKLTLDGAPSEDLHAATKKYVDDAVNNIPDPNVSGQINTHNTSETAHADIRTTVGSHISDTNNPHKVTAAQAGADPSGTAANVVSAHNTDTAAHDDIRRAAAAAAAAASNAQTTADNAATAASNANTAASEAKAAADTAQATANSKAPAYTYGTEDIEAGSASPYETGHLHFVYE